MVLEKKGPDFVGVGVEKCGTTWLSEVLSQHPEIFIPKKEIRFFSRRFYKGYEWYNNFFLNKNSRKAGEFTPIYWITPFSNPAKKEYYPNWFLKRIFYFWRRLPSARDELKTHYPEVKVFAIFRNPVERAWSDYWFHVQVYSRNGKRRTAPFEKVWSEDGRWIKTQGLYAHYVAYWREAFPDLGVFFYDDLKKDPIELARSVYRFIGVDDKFIPDISHWPLKGNYPPISPNIRKMMVDFFREQILQFSAMTGRDLSDWLKI